MNSVQPDPRIPEQGGRPFLLKLQDHLREHATAINQAATGNLWRSVTVSAAYTAGTGDLVVYVSPSGAFTVTLPPAKDMVNKIVTVKRKNNTTHTITIGATSGNIDGSASTTLTSAYQAKRFHSDGSDYYTV